MKIHILSDIHNEFTVYRPADVEADLVVLAGDINLGLSGAKWAVKSFPATPIVYVAGNHEYYSQVVERLNRDLKEFSDRNSQFNFLENDEVRIKGYRFIGCTMWSDFSFFGPRMVETARKKAEAQISDFYRIQVESGVHPEKIRSADLIKIHKRSAQFIKQKLAEPFAGKTIVVTHHAPSAKSLPLFHRRDILSAAFVANMEAVIQKYRPELWIHGHTHHNVDYQLNGTRIVSNQRGYFPMEVCKKFNNDLVIEL